MEILIYRWVIVYLIIGMIVSSRDMKSKEVVFETFCSFLTGLFWPFNVIYRFFC